MRLRPRSGNGAQLDRGKLGSSYCPRPIPTSSANSSRWTVQNSRNEASCCWRENQPSAYSFARSLSPLSDSLARADSVPRGPGWSSEGNRNCRVKSGREWETRSRIARSS